MPMEMFSIRFTCPYQIAVVPRIVEPECASPNIDPGKKPCKLVPGYQVDLPKVEIIPKMLR